MGKKICALTMVRNDDFYVCRPPYAWNKPAMFEMVMIVRIAERFRKIV